MTKFHDVYVIGDVTRVGTPKAGVFAKGEAQVAAEPILAKF
jgi:sulfide:quinone oxidoreductase